MLFARGAVAFLFTATLLAAPQDAGVTDDRAAREEAFRALMSGAVLAGHFTDSASSRPPQEERYAIGEVRKLRGDRWRLDTNIRYSGKDLTVPVVVEVRWAGDTPMIQLTDVAVPMLGKFTARVLVYGDRYAGTWAGADHGGHLFGKIEKAPPQAAVVDGAGRGGWSNWRGPLGSGAAPESRPPTEWSEDRNLRWKVELPGAGSSTPVVFGDRLFVTCAIETDQRGEPSQLERPDAGGERSSRPGGERRNRPRPPGGEAGERRGPPRGGFGGGPPTTVLQYAVVAFDRQNGEQLWQTVVAEGVPHERGHGTSTQAQNSAVTDGERLYAHFGSRGLHCLDLQGEVLWSVDFGPMFTRRQFGEGSSPALYGDALVVPWDHEGDSFIAVLDKHTGEERWRQPRDEPTSWATPVVVEVDGRAQVILPATNASRGYDLETGEEVWSCTGMTTNCIPTPIHRDGVVYLMSGFRGNALQAIRLSGARGVLDGTDHVLWSHNQNTSYVPSALLYGERLYFLRSNNGVLSCLDAATGNVHYEGQRLGLRTVYASPVGAGGHVYLTSRDGKTVVVADGDEYRVVAENQLDDVFDASIAVVGDVLYLRGRQHLYCVAASSS